MDNPARLPPKTIHVLLVEDSEDDALLLDLQLKASGYNPVIERVDSLQKLKLALDQPGWDIIISDYFLPGFSGLETLEILRSRNLDIPCLIVSGKIGEETAVAAMRGGAKDYIMKDKLKRLGPAIERELAETQVRRERTSAQVKLKQSEEKYRSLFDNMTEAFNLTEVVLDKRGKPCDYRILEANGAWKNLYGLSGEEVTGKTILNIFPVISHVWLKNAAAVALTGQPRHAEYFSQLSNKWLAVYFYSPKPGYIATISLDITQRKKAEEDLTKARDELEIKVWERTAELAASEEKYRSIVETANEGIVILNPEAVIIFVNKKFPDMIGYQARELVGKPIFDIIDSDYMEIIKEKLENRKRGIRESYELKFRCKDGSPLWVIISGNPLYDSEGQYIGSLGMHTDITAEKKLKDQLIDYAQRITRVQEEERKRIAYELHDDTAQYLSILKLQLDSLLKSGKIQSPEIIEKLEYLEKDAGRAVEDVRRYSHELRPGVLEHLGLRAALEQMADDVNKLKQITAEVDVEGTELYLSEEIKLGFFRIAQEALNNCRKHARCSKAIISLKFHENRVKMAISDNGVGFDPQEAIARTGLKGSLGLMSMQERAKLIGANLRIESKPGRGTTITVEKAIGA